MYNDSGIYCYKNIINNKLYIGQAKNLKRRYNDFKYKNGTYSGSLFQKAIIKYGKDNFQYSILTHCKLSELNYYESFYIKRLKTTNPKYGYNLTTGGDSAFQRTDICKENMRNAWTDDRRKIQSIKQQGCNNYNFGKKWSKEQKERASRYKKEEQKQLFFKRNGFQKKELTERIYEYIHMYPNTTYTNITKFFHVSHNVIVDICKTLKITKKIEKNIENLRNLHKKPIVQCDLNDHNIVLNIFPSLKEAEKLTQINSVKHCVYGKQGHAGGYFWRYALDGEKPYKNYNENYLTATNFKRKICKESKQRLFDSGLYKRENLYKKVYQYDKQGNLIKTYDSVKQTENYGFNRSEVSVCCKINGKQKTHKNYVFSYKELTPEEVFEKYSNNTKKPVVQLTLDNVFIKKWESATEASISLNLKISNISSCCRGKSKTCGGFKWKFLI